MSLQVVSGDQAGLNALTEGFNRGFQDYKYSSTYTIVDMQRFLKRSGMAIENCAVLVATEKGIQRGWGAVLMAVHGTEAWCGGLAVAPHFRRFGWGRTLMEQAHQQLQEQGIQTVFLEVLASNEAAHSLYVKLGYQKLQKLQIWEAETFTIESHTPFFNQLQSVDPAMLLTDFHAWHEGRVCWQRSIPYIQGSLSDLEGFLLSNSDGSPIAYALCQRRRPTAEGKRRIRLVDLAVAPLTNLLVIGNLLLKSLQDKYPDVKMTLLNEPEESLWNLVLEERGFSVVESQYEMSLTHIQVAPYDRATSPMT